MPNVRHKEAANNLQKELYTQSDFWSAPAEPYQVHVLADILNLLPNDTTSVLDVGCGNGYIIDSLPDHIEKVGMDISLQAVEHVRSHKLNASATDIPFADRSFDVVMANDVLEHLPDAYHDCAVREMERVARKYIIVTVPYNEQLETSYAKCADCGAVYHVNWHQRSYGVSELRELVSSAYTLVEIRLSGDLTRPPYDPTVPYRNQLGLYRNWEGAVCPSCLSKKQVTYAPDSMLVRVLDAYRIECWSHLLGNNNRSEVISLFAREKREGVRNVGQSAILAGNLLDIDFLNSPQEVHGDFTVGNLWSRYRLSSLNYEEASTSLVDKSMGLRETCMRLPVLPSLGDHIQIRAQGAREGDRLSLYAVDGLLAREVLLFAEDVPPCETEFDIPVNQEWWPEKFGTGLKIRATKHVRIFGLTYRPANYEDYERRFTRIASGHNVISESLDSVTFSWGMVASESGLIPYPIMDRGVHASETDMPESSAWPPKLLELIEKSLGSLRNQYEDLLSRLEEKETARDKAEQTSAAFQEQYADLAESHSKLAEAHAELAIAYNNRTNELNHTLEEVQLRLGIRGGVKEIGRSIKRHVSHVLCWLLERTGLTGLIPEDVPEFDEWYPIPWKPLDPSSAQIESPSARVLIISQMFPHPDHPLSGPFVLEQAKALRRYAAIDARVLVGRPLWLNHIKHPVTLLRSNGAYWRFLATRPWVELDGVPVKYLPYRVLGGHWSYGWMYRSAIRASIEVVRKEFPFDLVHSHSTYLDGTAGAMVAERFRVPLVITEHMGQFVETLSNPIIRHVSVRALSKADRIVTVSEALRGHIAAVVPHERRDRLSAIPNAVNVDLFVPPPTWCPDTLAPKFLFVGMFAEVKNLPLLLEAFAGVVAALPAARLTLAGGPEPPMDDSDLRAQVERLGLKASVKILGPQTRSEVARLMQDECDILVLSSKCESFGVVLVEAMACGKPVVATRCGGPLDIVTNADLGVLCPPNDVTALTRAMLEAIGRLPEFDPTLIREHAVSNFSMEAVAHRLASLYEEVLRECTSDYSDQENRDGRRETRRDRPDSWQGQFPRKR